MSTNNSSKSRLHASLGTLFSIILVSVGLTAEPSIPPESKEFNGKRYHVFVESSTWHEAKAKCEAVGGCLAMPTDQSTWTFVKSLSKKPLWLGATDEEREGVWKWLDGTPVTFAPWNPKQPDNNREQEHYLTTFQGGWSDVRNDSKEVLGFLCEWTSPTTSMPQAYAPQRKAGGGSVAPVIQGMEKSMQLRPGWNALPKGGEITIKDLALALQGLGRANPNPITTETIPIFEGVNYLMPLRDAVSALGLEKRPGSRKKVACPGFPKDTLDCVSFDGLFASQFNRLCLVVDAADQVVCVQLVEEAPKMVPRLPIQGSNTYNFIETRLKALGSLSVSYSSQLFNGDIKDWHPNASGPAKRPPQLARIDSVVRNDGKPLEFVRWYAPMPFLDLLQFCIAQSTKQR